MYAGLFTEFTIHLALGLSLALFAVSSQLVSSGFFRIQMWIVMGLDTFAGILLWTQKDHLLAVLTFVAAFVAYATATAWLYERAGIGKLGIVCVTLLNFVVSGGLAANPGVGGTTPLEMPLPMELLGGITSSCLLGFTVTAMLLGHWYLNVPGMKLKPLKVLLIGMAFALACRALTSAAGWTVDTGSVSWELRSGVLFSLRWIAGIAAVAVLCWMAWQTLRIPNTQSATGILYVAVILVFVGELSSHLISKEVPGANSLRLPELSSQP